MLEKFTSLEWVPYFDNTSPRSRKIIENPISFQNIMPGGFGLPLNATRAIAQVRRDSGEQAASVLREGVNRWRSLQILYEDCRWGTESYDSEEFERRRSELFEKTKKLEKQGRLARRMADAEREELYFEREMFWAVRAGADAV